MRDQRMSVPYGDSATVTPELLEAVARAVAAVLVPQPRPLAVPGPEEAADFLTAKQFAQRLGISHETVRRLAIAGVVPCTVVCRGARKTTRRFPGGLPMSSLPAAWIWRTLLSSQLYGGRGSRGRRDDGQQGTAQ